MRHKILLFFCFLGLAFSNPVQSQSNGRSFFKNLLSPDSLRGFDEEAYSKSALSEGLYGEEYKHALYLAKRQYIINKYYPNANDISNFKIISSQGVMNAPCVNEGFEAGNFSGWTTTIGTNTNSCTYPNVTAPLAQNPPLLSVLTTPFADGVTGAIIPNSPLGGTKVAKINNNAPNGKVIKLSQNFNVTTGNYLYDFAYYAIQNGPHTCCQQPYMFVRLRDCVGNLLACPQFTFNAPATNSASCAGTGPTAWINTGIGCPGQCVWRTNGWQKFSIDLTQYIGTCVTVEVMVADCSLTGHYLYTYFDSNCNTMNVTVNGTNTVSMPTQTVNVSAPCATTATLTAPSGLSPYTWNGPAGSGITNNTNQTISTAIAGNYTLVMNPFGICTPIFRIINLTFAPPVTVTAIPSSTICTGGPATLSATGATNYTWSPGGSNSPSIVVTPTTTTIYTLTAQSGTCIGTFTNQITVTPGPTVSISASSTSVCAGNPSTLTASGATSYTWSTGATGSVIVVSPASATTYSVIGSTGVTCTGTANINIGINPTPTNVVAVASPSYICSGSTTNLFGSAVGATTYSWFPGGLVGNFVSVSPLTTTIYTLIAANGSCTNSAQTTVSVSAGPTITPVASPAAICPGNSSTLSATGALSYTWNPGGTVSNSIVVSPIVTTIYSVTGVDVIGCTKTSTISLTVNPIPTINISPATSSICIGSSATLTASGATTYTWNPGNLTGASIVVSPASNTTYTVVGSNGTCTNSATRTVSVVPIPTVSASSSTTQICAGSSLTLTGSGATTYTWMPGSLSGANVTVSPTVTTTYTVTGSAGTCTSSAVVSVTVNNGPTMVTNASPAAVCLGNSSTLTATGAINYTWNPGALSGGTVTVTPASTTVYSVTGNNVLGCLKTQTLSVTVNTPPTINISPATSSICIGSSATLTASGATTYTWNPGNLTGASIVVSPASNTTYTVVGSNGTCTNSATRTVSVVPIPTVSASSSTTQICAGSSLTLTGSGATTYTWMPGSLSGANVTVSPTVTTTYTVTGSAGTCTSSAVVSVTVNNGPTIVTAANPTAVCPGNTSTLTASGATGYTWNPGALNGGTVTVTPASTTIYSVTANNAFGCTTTQTVNVTVNPNPTVTASASSATLCVGTSATLTASGASSYTWSPAGLTGTSVVITPTITTTHTLTGSTLGCTDTETITINVIPLPTVTAVSNPTAICNGSSATLTANGASTYTWMPGSMTGSSTVVSPTINTTYTVTGTSGNCTSTNTVALVVNPIPTVNATASPTAVCITGNVTLTATGASTYTWNPGPLTGNTVIVTPTVTTSYSVVGTSVAGCTNTAVTTVTVNSIPVLTVTASPTVICSGTSSTLTVLGATNYTWNPGALTGSNVVVSPTITTAYTVTASNGGCTTTAVVNLSVNPNPTVTTSASPTNICVGSSSTLTATGALNYTWNPGALTGATVAVSPTTTTIYTVTGATAAGCTSTATLNLMVSPLPTITAVANPTAICIGNSSTLTANGATSYTWNPGSLTGSNVVVSPTTTTTYTIDGTLGICNSSQTLNVVVNPLPTVTINASPATICSGSSTSLTAGGASTYTWNPGPLTGSTVVVSPTINTTYTVTGQSNVGCINTNTVTITVNPLPSLTVTSTATNICSGGSATLTAGGGISYFWNPGGIPGPTLAVNPTVTTTYTLIGTSGAGCLNSFIFTLSVTPTPTITAAANPTAICIGNSSTLTANGASNYTWSPGALTGSNIVVSPTITTTYSISGTTGICSSTQTLNLVVNSLPAVTASASSPTICSGNSTSLTASGASTYTWMPGPLTGSNVAVTPTITTTYSVTGTSSLGCTNSQTVSVTVNPLPTLIVSSTATNICTGNGATLTASGANSYTWNPGASTGTTIAVNPTVTTSYTLIGSSASGCTNTSIFTLSVTPVPTITAVSNPTAICAGNSATLSATGASNYTWNPGATIGSSVIVSPVSTTNYTVIGANGICSSSATLNLVVNSLPTITATASSPTICTGSSTSLTASGASTYTWNPGTLTGSNVVVSPTITTNYTVTATNSLGCSNATTVSVVVNPKPTLTITSTATNICSGSSATLTGTGANTYSWNPGAATGSTFVVSPLTTTAYTLTGTNISGCTNTAVFTLTVTNTPTISATASASSICSGATTTLSATGATTYSWNPGALTGSNVVVTPTSTTMYTVTGINGICSSTAAITITVNSSPNLTVTSNPTVICPGNSATLTASGASTYTWISPSSNNASVVVSPTTTTIYTVTGTNGNGCVGNAFVTLSVTPTPTITASSSSTAICSGANVTLTANGGSSYTWTPGSLTGTTIVVSPTVTTTYTVNGNNGACSGNAMITVIVNTTPTLTAGASPTLICSGSSATLTASGATTYSWNPGSVSGSSVVVTPTTNTTYTLVGANGNCTSASTLALSVQASPTISIVASATSICKGNTTTLTATIAGATTSTWNPGALSGTLITVSPTITTVYSLTAENSAGCSTTQTVQIAVLSTPTVTASASPTAVCLGNSSTLTASGATSYTWEPGTITTSVNVVTPTVTTVYTLTGSNGTCGTSTATISITVNNAPAGVSATAGTITCTTPSVNLIASPTATNLGYVWNGPGGFTTAVQNPTGIAIPGNYTITVTDLTTGCSASNTVAITTDTTVPTLTATANGTITCSNTSATLNVVASATNAAYNWSGPASFTSSAQSFTTASGGTYTITVTDLSSNCMASNIVIVETNTTVPITATILPATCSGTMANNDGSILAGGYTASDKFDLVAGTSYTGTATYTTAVTIPGSGILINTLTNPTTITPYTVRFFAANGCYKDTTLYLIPTSCITNSVFGVAKAVSTPTLKTNGTYDVNYFIVVKNTGTQDLNSISLTENLSATFPSPTAFSITAGPVITSINSSLTIDPTFNGTGQTVMTIPATSTLAAGKSDTIMFTVNITHNGNFGPFNNTVLGFSSPTTGVVFADSSNTGYDPDPDTNGTPTDNNLPTVLNLTPNLFFGLTKVGTVSEKLSDNTFDISYTITVHNLGNDTLRNVTVKDSLFNNTIRQPATYTMKSGPFANGSLIANSSFNGNTDINLLLPLQSKIAPGAINTIEFTINVVPDTITVVKNSAFGTAVNTTSIMVSDTSNAGSNPDSNGNGVWNEVADNVVTVLTIPSSTLFIPGGFSPDGDDKNDKWVIKGLPSGIDNTITIYNRWGNKVYSKDNYDNSWNGYPNVTGTLGSDKLPQGTYYYIIEFKGGDMKPLNGFVVIQY